METEARKITVELRVHGVSGTPTVETLHDPHPIQVAGDSDTLFVRSGLPTTPVEPGLLVESQLAAHPKVERHGRVLEAYHWGSLTAGSAIRAFYMTLIPFLLVNVAYWAVPHATCWEDETRRQVIANEHPWVRLTRAVIKLFALALSIELILASALVAIDLYAWQYGAVAQVDPAPAWPGRLLSLDLFRPFGRTVVVGAVLCVLVTAFFNYFGAKRWDREQSPAPYGDQGMVGPFAHTQFWTKRDVGQGMRRLHVVAMRAVLVALAAGVARAGGGKDGDSPVFVAAITLALAFLLFAVILVAYSEWWPGGRDVPPAVGRFEAFALVARILQRVTNVLLLVVLVLLWRMSPAWTVSRAHPLPELSGALWTTATVQAGLAVLLAVLLFVVRVTRGGRGQLAVSVPGPAPVDPSAPGSPAVVWPDPAATVDDAGAWSRGFHPAAGGFVPLVLVVAAWQLAAALSAGLAILVARVLGTPVTSLPSDPSTAAAKDRLTLPDSYWGVSTLWAIGAGVLLVFAVLGLIVFAMLGKWSEWVADAVALIEPPLTPDAASQADAVARSAVARKIGAARVRGHLLKHDAIDFIVMLVAYMAGVAVVGAALLPSRSRSGWLKQQDLNSGVLPYIGSWLLVAVAAALLLLGRSAYRSAGMRRRTGTFFDVACFWPRVAHPFAPPCYGERAVPDLVQRVELLLELDAESPQPPVAEPPTAGPKHRVILAGHSQGSLICFCVVMQLYGRHGADKLRGLSLMTYGSQLRWAFPQVFPSYVGYWEQAVVRSQVLDHRWRNMFRHTDPIGDRVLEPPLPPGSADEDVFCTDPQSHHWDTVDGTAAVRMHGDYFSSVGYDRAAGELVALMGGSPDEPLPGGPQN